MLARRPCLRFRHSLHPHRQRRRNRGRRTSHAHVVKCKRPRRTHRDRPSRQPNRLPHSLRRLPLPRPLLRQPPCRNLGLYTPRRKSRTPSRSEDCRATSVTRQSRTQIHRRPLRHKRLVFRRPELTRHHFHTSKKASRRDAETTEEMVLRSSKKLCGLCERPFFLPDTGGQKSPLTFGPRFDRMHPVV